MKITIKNFGPIDFLEFDLEKDLHLIYGQNAVGKSYATYCIYCLLKTIKNQSYRYTQYTKSIFSEYIKTKTKILNTHHKIDITNEYLELINQALSHLLLKDLQNSLYNTFSSIKNLRNQFTNQNFELSLRLNNIVKMVISSDETGKLQLKYVSELAENYYLEKKAKYLYLLRNNEVMVKSMKDAHFVIVMMAFCQTHFLNIQKMMQSFHFRTLYFLPASRSGLYQALNTLSPILAEIAQNRFLLTHRKIELPTLSEPVADYFLDLSTVDKQNQNPDFQLIIDNLQNNILNGSIDYDETTSKILYKPNRTDLVLNLSEASSMVSEISPFVIYLKHIINHKHNKNQDNDWNEFIDSNVQKSYNDIDILFIEEPEAHLHPEVQVALMEVFAKLSTLNLKIFITTHSNYMFDKLNNLILSNELDNNKVAVYHLVKNENGSTYNKQVAVTKDGIEDENFQETSEKLYEERMRIYDK
jgi:AAA ATPase domain